MIKVKSGQERSVYTDLQKKPEVRDVYHLFGEYNFFLVVHADGRKDLGQMLSQINDEQNVIKTGPILFTADSDSERINELDSATTLG